MSDLHKISGCDDAERKADVVFIHGLGGDAFGTWRHGEDESTSWPHWLGEEFPEVGVWSLGYPASATKLAGYLPGKKSPDAGHSMALPDRAGNVLGLMVHNGLGERPMLLICHSLGGLVAKQVLRQASDATAKEPKKQAIALRTRAVLFLATPHAGAELASLLDSFRAVFGSTVTIKELREHDANLRGLFNWYRNHAPELGIQTESYFETRPIRGVTIVNPTSAHPGVGVDPEGLDEDHISIAKPRERDEHVCLAARDLLRDYVLADRPDAPTAARAPAGGPTATPVEVVVRVETAAPGASDMPRVPHELPPAAEKFFGRQADLKKLIKRLREGKNTAVVGFAGLGKTALAAEAVREVVGKTAATLADSPYPDGVVFLDFYRYQGLAETAWESLANKLRGAEFMERSPARERATEACRGRRILVIVEGGEEADGLEGRANIREFLADLSPENRWLLLTRVSTQANPAESITLKEALNSADAGRLFDSLTGGSVTAKVREDVLGLLEGHPLALTWAGNLLARNDEQPARLISDWQAEPLPALSDPTKAEHTLEWLFKRSARGLDETAQRVLEAAGLLAPVPVPLGAMVAARAGSEPRAERAALDALKSLVQRGLMRRSDDDDHWQFTHALGYRFARKESGSDTAIRERLGQWLHQALVSALAPGGSHPGWRSTGRLLEHADALLRTDEAGLLWRPLGNYLLYSAADRLTELGSLGRVKLALGGVQNWLERLPAEASHEPTWTRERSVLDSKVGDVLSAQGDLAGALVAYEDSLAISRRLAEVDPSNAGWQRDLSVSYNKVGDVLRAEGDLAGALVAYEDGLAIARRLAEADRGNPESRRDLSVSQEKVGAVLRAQGDLTGALVAYKNALAIATRLAEADPSNAGWQRDLSVGHNQVGDMFRAQGDLAGALAAYNDGLAIRKKLAEADPSNAGWQRDLSVSHSKAGDVLRAQGDLAGALVAYQDTLAVTRRLAEADPSNAGWQRDLSVGHNRVGDVLRAQGDLAGALVAFNDGLAIARRLAEADPSNAGWQRDLSFSLTRMAQLHEQQDNRTDALGFAEESLAMDERLAALDPTNVTCQNDVAVSRALVERLRG